MEASKSLRLPVCVCVCHVFPHVCVHTQVSPGHTCAHRCTPGLWSESSRQIVGCPVWEHWLSLLLTEFEVVGVKQEGAGFRPQGPPTEWQAVGACLWACEVSYPGELGASPPLPEVVRQQLLARGAQEGPCWALGAPRGLYFLSLPGIRSGSQPAGLMAACGAGVLGKRTDSGLCSVQLLRVLDSVQVHLGPGPGRRASVRGSPLCHSEP